MKIKFLIHKSLFKPILLIIRQSSIFGRSYKKKKKTDLNV